VLALKTQALRRKRRVLKPRQLGKRCVRGRLAPWLCDLPSNLTAIYHFGIVPIEPRDGGE
jgi:hypothetical protein